MSEAIQFLCYFFFDDISHFAALCIILLLAVPHKFIEIEYHEQEKDKMQNNAGNGSNQPIK